MGQRTADLETVDDKELTLNKYAKDFVALREENKMLLSRLKDAETRSYRSNLQQRGIPESIDDLNSFTTTLFQELSPSNPIEC